MPREEEGVWSTGVLFGITPLSLAWAQVFANTEVAAIANSGPAWEQVNWERCLTELHRACMCTAWDGMAPSTLRVQTASSVLKGGEDILFVLQAITKAIRHAERESNLGLKSLAPECSGPKLSFKEAQR